MRIATPGNIPSLEIGGRIFTDLVNLITLIGAGYNPSNTNCTLRKLNASAGYVVPTGKQFRILAIKARSDVAVDCSFRIVYTDNDMGFGTNTAGTNIVYSGGTTISSQRQVGVTTSSQREFETNFVVPAGKYPSIIVVGGTAASVSADVYGYEESV